MANGNDKNLSTKSAKDPRFPLADQIPLIKSATSRNKKAIKCMMNALKKYHEDCEKASTKFTTSLMRCLEKMDEDDEQIEISHK
jgi:hypothetical protein